MNDKDILELEKQLIPDLPADFWEIKEAADRTYSFWDRIIYYGLVIGAIFQVVCLLSLVFLKAHAEERNFSPDSHHINLEDKKRLKDSKKRK